MGLKKYQIKPLKLSAPKVLQSTKVHPTTIHCDPVINQWDYKTNNKIDLDLFYTSNDFPMLLNSKSLYEKGISESNGSFDIEQCLQDLVKGNSSKRIISASKLLYYSQGNFPVKSKEILMDLMKEHNAQLVKLGTFPIVYKIFKLMVSFFDSFEKLEDIEKSTQLIIDAVILETTICLCLLYMMVTFNSNDPAFVKMLASESPYLPSFLFQTLVKLAEGNRHMFPVKKVINDYSLTLKLLLLVWRVLDALVGNEKTIANAKQETRNKAGLSSKQKSYTSTSPQEYLHHHTILSYRYPSYFLPDLHQTIPGYVPGMCVPLSNNSKRLLYQYYNPIVGQLDNALQAHLEISRHSVIVHPNSFSNQYGIPISIQESIDVHMKNLHIAASSLQLAKERQISQQKCFYNEDKSTDMPLHTLYIKQFYETMSIELPQIITMLIRLLFYLNISATGESNASDFSKLENLTGLSEDQRKIEFEKLENIKHRESVTHVVSCLILLILIVSKRYHICGFEHVSQTLVENNGPILLLKLLSAWFVNPPNRQQKQTKYPAEDEPVSNFLMGGEWLSARPHFSELSFMEFCLQNNSSTTPVNLQQSSNGQRSDTTLGSVNTAYQGSPQNFLTTINLLRILQKLTKNKTHRILLLVKWKASAVLKRMLKVNNTPLQLYALKLIKSQTPYLGKKWRTNNMHIVSLIYMNVRHKLKEDYLAGDADTDPEEALQQELNLKRLVNQFHERLCSKISNTQNYPPSVADGLEMALLLSERDGFDSSNPAHSALLDQDQSIPELLDDNFKTHYEEWLHTEVYTNNTVHSNDYENIDLNKLIIDSPIDISSLKGTSLPFLSPIGSPNRTDWSEEIMLTEEESLVVDDSNSTIVDEFTEGWTDGIEVVQEKV
ncbi:hypothetical protein BC833DRAFT_620614 [Globomyces pollinis-pini]|nr:hypothetical protein BC833DRAFT_620614 [Globomyces pollinis-pini]